MKMRPSLSRSRIAACAVAAILVPLSLTPRPSPAQDAPAQDSPAQDSAVNDGGVNEAGANGERANEARTERFSPEVVAKAEQILQQAGLRHSGKSIQATETADISRAIMSLAREKRELGLVYQQWKKANDHIAAIHAELRQLNAQDVELNLQLVRVAAGDVTSNNRIVGLLNASRAQAKERIEQREHWKKELAARRAALNAAEVKFADTVLAIRKDFLTVRDQLAVSLEDERVQIALRVMQANFQTPSGLTADKILAALDRRIAKIEQEIFSETIDLEVERGGLYVDVVVGKKSARMVLDSGAALITLPTKTAADLGIEVPVDARQINLMLADGRTIPARGVVLPKVRIGEFEAHDVEAAVLDAVATQAEPLLGMSFLSNFKFEIDTDKKSLKLLRVAAE